MTSPDSPQRRRSAADEDFRAAYAHHRAGRLDRAEALYQKVLKKVPTHADALNLLGVIALERGRAARAVQLIGKAVEASPNFADAHSNLGNALMAAGHSDAAIAAYRRAIALKPDFAAAYSNLGRAYNAVDAFGDALAACEAAIQRDPNLPETHYNKALALRALGRLGEAEAACRTALRLRPEIAEWERVEALLLADLERTGDALALLDRLLLRDPKDVASQVARAGILYRSGDLAGAERDYRRATELAPDDAEAWTGLGRSARTAGRFAEAEAAFRRALAVAPTHADAHRNLALIGRLAADRPEAEGLAGLIADAATSPQDRVAAGFALGKLLDDADRFDEAFARYSAANALHRALQQMAGKRFDAAQLIHDIDRIIDACSPARLAELAAAGTRSDLPVFIVGMPRSGTSLVEQIVASHPQVFGAGELTEVGRMVATLGGGPEAAAGAWAGWDAEAARRAAAAHLDRLAALGGGAMRVIDKLPDNIFMLGAIAALFPDARVIFCRRDARDTCLSCYFTLFMRGNLFSYDLADCAVRQRETSRLRRHWQTALPLATHVVTYEALVADLEGESRRLIEFLGVPWNDACLRFHETSRPVVTASSWQVRQPLYNRSVGRWRHYARHLGALGELSEADG